MTHLSRSQPTIADLAALSVALDRDEQRPRGEAEHRDREIAAAMTGVSDDPRREALAWIDQLAHREEEIAHLRERVSGVVAWAGMLIAALGLVVGWVAALGVFYYDGSGRVNVIGVIAAFVMIPTVLLLPLLLAALPGRVIAWLPGGVAAAGLSRMLSPGRLAGLSARWLPQEQREALARVLGQAGAHQRLYAGVQKWAVLRWSQLFALGFQTGALTAAVGLVVFTDLAFGWSTTLTTGDPVEDAAVVHRITSAAAGPWAWAWPSADPALALIESSRYYRIAVDPVTPQRAANLGGWWPFVVMAMLVYGLLPRAITYAFADYRLRVALGAALVGTPGLSTVLRRLHQAHVRTAASEPEQRGGESGVDVLTQGSSGVAAVIFSAVINWSAVPVEDATLASSLGLASVNHAGGAVSLSDDADLARRLGEQARDGAAVAIVVKAWEPPMMEFVDFVRALRAALGDRREVVVWPVSLAASGAVRPGEPGQVAVWRKKLASVGDPWLRVEALESQGIAGEASRGGGAHE